MAGVHDGYRIELVRLSQFDECVPTEATLELLNHLELTLPGQWPVAVFGEIVPFIQLVGGNQNGIETFD
jgi:hypothetical protein